MADRIAKLLTLSPSSMPKKIAVANNMAGQFHIDDLCEALVGLTASGVINGFDAEQAHDTGHGYISIL